MNPFYFVGSECELDGTKLTRLGQKVNLAADAAKTGSIGGAQLLPEDQFTSIGFTDEELKLYPHVGQQRGAPADFKAKLKAAWVAASAYRAQLETPQLEIPQEGK